MSSSVKDGEQASHPVVALGARPSFTRDRVLSSLFLPAGAILATAVLLGCDPGTTRPDVLPFPDSRQIEVILDRQQAITRLEEALVADSFPVAHFQVRDAWLEGPWMDRRTLKPASAGALGRDVVRLRAWAEPARPGNSYLIVELAWRATADPSVPPRSLERAVPTTDSLTLRVEAVLKKVDGQFGFHSTADTTAAPAGATPRKHLPAEGRRSPGSTP